MKLRTLAALLCALALSLGATGMVFANDGECQDEQGAWIDCATATASDEEPTATASDDEPTATASDDESASPTDEETASPSDEETASPTDEETASPTDEETASPTDEETASPTDEETASPTDEETASPTDEETASPSDEESETPSDEPTGETEAETGTPSVTLPPTDGLSGGSSTGTGGLPIALVAMGGLLAAVLLLTPATLGVKRARNRD